MKKPVIISAFFALFLGATGTSFAGANPGVCGALPIGCTCNNGSIECPTTSTTKIVECQPLYAQFQVFSAAPFSVTPDLATLGIAPLKESPFGEGYYGSGVGNGDNNGQNKAFLMAYPQVGGRLKCGPLASQFNRPTDRFVFVPSKSAAEPPRAKVQRRVEISRKNFSSCSLGASGGFDCIRNNLGGSTAAQVHVGCPADSTISYAPGATFKTFFQSSKSDEGYNAGRKIEEPSPGLPIYLNCFHEVILPFEFDGGVQFNPPSTATSCVAKNDMTFDAVADRWRHHSYYVCNPPKPLSNQLINAAPAINLSR